MIYFINIFCSINFHYADTKVPDPVCTEYVLGCISNSTNKYKELACMTNWVLNNNREMGRCPSPELLKRLDKQRSK